jgi:hypothetical protein
MRTPKQQTTTHEEIMEISVSSCVFCIDTSNKTVAVLPSAGTQQLADI